MARLKAISILKWSAGSRKDTLFLIIHDQAHYEATRNEAKGKRLVDKFINSETVLTSKNVVTLLVSAMPYSLVSV